MKRNDGSPTKNKGGAGVEGVKGLKTVDRGREIVCTQDLPVVPREITIWGTGDETGVRGGKQSPCMSRDDDRLERPGVDVVLYDSSYGKDRV